MIYKTISACSVIFISVAMSACAGSAYKKVADSKPDYQFVRNDLFSQIAEKQAISERDKAAILAMQGEYVVDFHFQETVVLDAAYQKHKSKDTSAHETVVVIENSPKKVVLQHLLVSEQGAVIKHWRQDWEYEATERFEFVADQTWQLTTLAADKTKGAWTQCVYEVSDAPRYCGTGHWSHRYGVSTWTSDRSWRPLPRREYTTRDDYNAINAENRHTVTALGWTHEQDNTKTIRKNTDTQKTLVREFGFNNYRRIEGYNFQPAYDYWQKTATYWQQVREAWSKRLQSARVILKTDVDGMPIIKATFAHAADIEKNIAVAPGVADIEGVLNQWVSIEE